MFGLVQGIFLAKNLSLLGVNDNFEIKINEEQSQTAKS